MTSKIFDLECSACFECRETELSCYNGTSTKWQILMQMMIQKCKKWTFLGTTSKRKELESCATSQIEGNLIAT